MEKHEFEDDTIPHAILAHQRQVAVEKATEVILKAESICDKVNDDFRDVEAWQVYPINTFR